MGSHGRDLENVIGFPGRRGLEPWWTKAQVARHLRVSERTVERWARDGMPCLRAGRGRTVRYRASEVEAWLARGGAA